MVDFGRLSANWLEWAPALGGGSISFSTDCDDCEILVSSDDSLVHLRKDNSWWVVDTVSDRGQRQGGAAKFSNFDLTEKYLIWDWATTARASLASGSLGADLAQRGYAPGVKVSRASRGCEICSNDGCAILSFVNATIFSHLMSTSVDEIERLIRPQLD